MAHTTITYYAPDGSGPYSMRMTNSLARFLVREAPAQIARLFAHMTDGSLPPKVLTLYIQQKPTGEISMDYFALRKGAEPVISFLPSAKFDGVVFTTCEHCGGQTEMFGDIGDRHRECVDCGATVANNPRPDRPAERLRAEAGNALHLSHLQAEAARRAERRAELNIPAEAIEADPWSRAGRQTVKPGRWINSLLTPKALLDYGITEGIIEKFTNVVKSYVTVDYTFEEVRGGDIATWYDEATYAKGGGPLGKSCMRYARLGRATFDLYTLNPACSMLLCLDKNRKLLGRALVWRDVKTLGPAEKLRTHVAIDMPESITLLDRIYYAEDYIEDAFKEYAKGADMYHKLRQTPDCTQLIVAPDGLELSAKLSIPTGIDKRHRHYPYCDTMRYLSGDFKMLYNSHHKGKTAYELLSTQGDLPGFVDRDGQVQTELDGWIREEYLALCRDCSRTGAETNMNYVLAVPRSLAQDPLPEGMVCRYCLEKLYVWSDHNHTNIPLARAVPARSVWGYTDYVCEGQAVHSRYHGYDIILDQAIHLPYYNDYVFNYEGLVHSRHHNTFLIEAMSVYSAELNDYIDKLRIEVALTEWRAAQAVEAQVQEAAEQLIPARDKHARRKAAKAHAIYAGTVSTPGGVA